MEISNSDPRVTERQIVSVTPEPDGIGFAVKYDCGHEAVWVIKPMIQSTMCAECVNEVIDEIRGDENQQG